MERQFREGEVFAHYLLDRKISDAARLVRWVATNQQTGERTCLTLLDESPDSDTWQQIRSKAGSLRGLLHENISTVSAAETAEGLCFLVEPWFRDAQTLRSPGSEEGNWRIIRQLLAAVSYFQGLGIVHGSIQPDNILVDGDGHLRLTGFLTTAVNRDINCMSPQVTSGAAPDRTDDVYAVGQVIFMLITGKFYSPGVEIDTPLPAAAEQMLQALLSESSIDRHIDMDELQKALSRHFDKPDQRIQSVSFTRADADSVTPAPEPPIAERQRDGVSMPIALSALALIIILAALLLPLLPGDPPAREAGGQAGDNAKQPTASAGTQPAAGQAEPAPVVTPLEAARLERLKQEGERLGREILKLQIELEDAGVTMWAGEAYQALTERLGEADVIYRENRFDDAFGVYKQVQQELTALVEQIPDVLTEQLTLGDDALAAGDAEAAVTAFTIATTLAPMDRELAKKLERAENLDETMRLTNQAEAHERNGDFAEALDTFNKATVLDPDWQRAAEGLKRVRTAIRQQNFQAAMSKGFTGIASRDYEAARKGFQSAQKIMPGSLEPADGLLQVEQAERNDQIAGYRRTAEQAMAQYDWNAAIAAYDKALTLAPSLEFARAGRAQAGERIALETGISRLLSDPTLLQADSEYTEASNLIRKAARLPSASDTFLRDVNRLAQLVSSARVEIPVTIRSNGATSITVRRVKALGEITSETVYLIPGKYTIVGERTGYRDVRHELVLLPGYPAPEIILASDERVP